MAVNTIQELIDLLNEIDSDAQSLQYITNDAADSTAHGPSAGLVTTRSGTNVKNVRKVIQDIEDGITTGVRPNIQDEGSTVIYGAGAINFVGAAVNVTNVSGTATVAIADSIIKVGTPVNNQIGVWTGDGTLEGDANLAWDGSALTITGNIAVSGTVDGRDIATDGAKLDSIEINATADQTGLEIKTLYESEPDTNAFTNAEQTKLANIEANADVTDTTNVTSAGALMDSELTDESAVKAINQGLTTTSDVIFGDVTVSGVLKTGKGSDVTSASALALGTDGNFFDVTGTTTVTSINTWHVGGRAMLQFDSSLILTHNATNLILPGSTNITTASGDIAEFVEYSTGNWICVNYQRADIGPNDEVNVSNLIINGAMQVAQRGTSETGVTTSGYYTVDRWKFNINVAGSWTIEQGLGLGEHAKSLKVTCTTADASLAAGDFIILSTALEGQDLQHLRKGTVDAKALSLGLIMKSDETKTFICELYDNDNGRHVCGSMTVTSSDVEQKVSFAFAGDTSGVLDNDANASLQLNIWLAAGSNFTSGTLQTSWSAVVQANRAVGCDNLADAVNNYFEITGVQLVPGETLPPFRHEPYGDVLQKCLRYYQPLGRSGGQYIWTGDVTLGNSYYTVIPTKGVMRATPTVTFLGQGDSGFNLSTLTANQTHDDFLRVACVSDQTTARGYYEFYLTLDAEL